MECKFLISYLYNCYTVGNSFVCKQGFKRALVAYDRLFQTRNFNFLAAKQVIFSRIE